MKCILVSMDNGESYEDNQVVPIVVCANKESALRYIDSHPINDESFKEVFHYKYAGRGRYVLDEVEIFTG